jgi:hypothetical protein
MKAEDELAEKILEQLGITDKIEGMDRYLKRVRKTYNMLDRCITDHGDERERQRATISSTCAATRRYSPPGSKGRSSGSRMTQ